MQIAQNTVATIDYTLTDDSGEVIDSSKDHGPLTYLHGSGNIIPGLEAALEGKSAGDALSVKIEPDQAYGERDAGLVQAIPRDEFPDDDIEVGMQFRTDSRSGPRIVTVVEVNDETVTVDANHPLAGQRLSFEVKVVKVRDATADELSHGHVHDDDGHGGHGHGHGHRH
jgi:FKBP-type peptidyl-prolyl cis-trans isomerase SlyD